ncbi:MAG: RsmE family RNA methyltransferase [Candidatus Methylomirabilis sp.]
MFPRRAGSDLGGSGLLHPRAGAPDRPRVEDALWGHRRIVPVLCQRSVARGSGRLPRWRHIAQEAAEQCGRAVVPQIDEPIRFIDLSAALGSAGLRGITLWEDERSRGFKDALQHMATVDPLYLLVGPEGGLAPDEVKMAGGLGFVTASLGRRTLRTETATIAAVSIIQYELGDLGKP